MTHKEKRPPAATGEALKKDTSRNSFSAAIHKNQAIPSRAALARNWPRLRLNRYTGAWLDDATGKRGDDVESLLVFLQEGGR